MKPHYPTGYELTEKQSYKATVALSYIRAGLSADAWKWLSDKDINLIIRTLLDVARAIAEPLAAELAEERMQHGMTQGCLDMVKDALKFHDPEADHAHIPPMMFDDWINSIIQKKVKAMCEQAERIAELEAKLRDARIEADGWAEQCGKCDATSNDLIKRVAELEAALEQCALSSECIGGDERVRKIVKAALKRGGKVE